MALRLLVVVVAAFALAAETANARVEVVDASGAKLAQIRVATVPGTAKGRAIFYLRQSRPPRGGANAAVKGLSLFADVQDVDISLAVAGAAADATFTLRAAGMTRVVASVDDPPVDLHRGQLMLDGANGSRALVPMTVRRDAGDVLSIEQAGQDGIVETTPLAAFDRTYDVVSTSPSTTPVRIEVRPFETNRGTTANPEVRVNGAPLEAARRYAVSRARPLRLRIAATLTAIAKYESRIRLLYDDTPTGVAPGTPESDLAAEPKSVALTVTREADAANFVLSGDPTTEVALEGFSDSGTARYDLDVRETEGRIAQTGTPELRLYRQKGSSLLFVPHEHFTVNGLPPAPLTLDPLEPQTIRVAVEGLGPGQWTPKLRIPGGEGAVQEVSATVFVRTSALVAALLILVGVVASFFARRLWVDRRSKLLARRELVATSERLETVAKARAPGPIELETVDDLRRQIKQADADLDLPDGVKAATTTAQEVEGKLAVLSHWLELCGIARAAGIPEEEWPAALGRARRFLEDDLQTDAATVAAELEEADAAVVGRAALDRQLDALEEALVVWELDHSGKAPRGVAKALDNARKLLATDVDAARAAYGTAAKALAGAAAGELAGLLQPAPPEGVGDGEWADVKRAVADAVSEVRNAEGADAIPAYTKGYTLYLRAVATGLRKTARSAAVADVEELDAIVAALDTALKVIDKDLSRARALYEQAAAQWNDLVAAATASLRQAWLATGITGAAAPQGNTVPTAAAGTTLGALAPVPAGAVPRAAEVPLSELQPASRVRRDVGTIELVVLSISVVVSVFLGLQLLYLDNASWGGLEDCLIAVLWGLGVHQATAGATFAGLKATADTISGVQPAKA